MADVLVHSVPVSQSVPPDDDHDVRYALIAGGCFDGAKDVIERHVDIVFELDSFADLKNRRSHVNDVQRTTYIPTGFNQTSDTLLESAPPTVREFYRSRGMADSVLGAGQARVLGSAAEERERNTPRGQELLRRLPRLHQIAGNGVVRGATIYVFASLAGGMGSGTCEQYATAIAEQLATLGCRVRVEFFNVGAVSFLQCGDRVLNNTAAGLWELAQLISRPDRNPLITHRVRLIELLPFGTDQAARDRALRLDLATYLSREPQRFLRIEEPNQALDSCFGSVFPTELQHESILDAETEVAPAAAALMVQNLEGQMRRAAPVLSRIEAIETTPSAQPCRRETIDNIIDDVFDEDPDQLLEMIERSGETLEYAVTIVTDEGTTYDPWSLESDFASPPQTCTRAIEDSQLLGSISLRLNRQVESIGRQEEAQQREQERLRNKFRNLVHRLQEPKRRGIFESSEQLEAKVLALAEDLRNVSDARRRTERERATLTVAHNLAKLTEERHRQMLNELLTTLREWCPRQRKGWTGTSLIVTKTLDVDFQDLLRLPRLPRAEQLRQIEHRVAGVTLEGLARIVGAAQPRIEPIAQRLARGECAVKHPPLGGQAGETLTRPLLVLPPLPSTFRQPLLDEVRRLNSRLDVLFADSVDGGCSVVRYEIAQPRELSDIFRGPLRKHLIEALREPQLYFRNGTQGLNPDHMPPWA